jgi:hypothetical protein
MFEQPSWRERSERAINLIRETPVEVLKGISPASVGNDDLGIESPLGSVSLL